MSALLVKDAPDGLHRWLKDEAAYNRRSLNQQVLVCLEWCMRTYGEARPRDPFVDVVVRMAQSGRRPSAAASGAELARRLAAIPVVDDASAVRMKSGAGRLRKSKAREFEYACFD